MSTKLSKIICKISLNVHVLFEQEEGKKLSVRYSMSDSKIKENPKGSKTDEEYTEEVECFGIFGIVNLLIHKYLILISEVELAGTLLANKPVWKVKGFTFHKIGSLEPVELSQKKSDGNFRELLQKVFDTESFYFSNTYDLTNTMQDLTETPQINPNSNFFINEGFVIFKVKV